MREDRGPLKVLVVFGTRPEAIKLVSVIRELHDHPRFTPVVAVTGQHREMLDQVLSLFRIAPDFDLDIMEHGQTLSDITTRSLDGVESVILASKPDILIVQGDTTTTFAAALAAFYQGVTLIHVEAGYRTGDKRQPFPEEINRRLVSELADWHFAVNEQCRDSLLREGHDASRIRVVGNTGIDALMMCRSEPYTPEGRIATALRHDGPLVLATMHRRENWGEPLVSVCAAIRQIAGQASAARVVLATHMNPRVREVAQRELGGTDRVDLLPPLEYLSFIKLLDRADVVMTDSGGVHEEARALGKPLVLLRNVSEWPEAVHSGQVVLAGTELNAVATAALRALAAVGTGTPTPTMRDPLADGRAAQRIVSQLDLHLTGSSR